MVLSTYSEERTRKKLKRLIIKPWVSRGRPRTDSTFKTEVFVIMLNWQKLLSIATKSSIIQLCT